MPDDISSEETWRRWEQVAAERRATISSLFKDITFQQARDATSNGTSVKNASVEYRRYRAEGGGRIDYVENVLHAAILEFSPPNDDGIIHILLPMNKTGSVASLKMGDAQNCRDALIYYKVPNPITIGRSLEAHDGLLGVSVSVSDNGMAVEGDGFLFTLYMPRCHECGAPKQHFGVIEGLPNIHGFSWGTGGVWPDGYSDIVSVGGDIICGKPCADAYNKRWISTHSVPTLAEANTFAARYAKESGISYDTMGTYLAEGRGWTTRLYKNNPRGGEWVVFSFDFDGKILAP